MPPPGGPGVRAVPAARALLREVMGAEPLAGRLADGELGLSELVTNAVLHGREPIVLTLSVRVEVARVEVSDAAR